MLRKLISVAAIALLTVSPVLAQERTFVTNPPTTSGAGIIYNSGTDTVTATGADGARIYSVTRPIERAQKYRYEFTVTDYVAGGVQPYIGTIRDNYVNTTVMADVPASSSVLDPGATPIADNFTTINGLLTGQALDSVQTNDSDMPAFRLFCASSHIASDDPLVVPNMQGAAHLHNFFGNTGTNAYSTYKSLRTSGGSSCGTDQNNPINRTAYWFPAMKDGKGNAIATMGVNVYYKRKAATQTACTSAEGVRIGICTRLPHGLAFIWGYNMTTMTPDTANNRWECRSRVGGVQIGDVVGGTIGPSAGGVSFDNLNDLRNAGTCPIGATIVISSSAPACWNGTQLRTPDNRAHMAYFVSGRCPATHPYHITEMTHQAGWIVDGNLPTWRLSSDDQMGMGVDSGETWHTDVWYAWSPAYKTQWFDGCIDGRRSCSTGANGQGQAIKGNIAVSGSNSRLVPIGRLGLGFIRRKNGAFTGEFTAGADGEFGLDFLLFTGKVTGFKVTKITKGASGPVTQPVTQ